MKQTAAEAKLSRAQLAKEAKKILKPIPDEEWIMNAYTDSKGKCCGLGHYGRIKAACGYELSEKAHEEYGKLNDQVFQFTKKRYGIHFGIPDVNDNVANIRNFYPQETPKARVIKLLDDMARESVE